ncbi:MAG: hypothetical protein IJV96_03165 [Clostridia bacterium]|nr:hypothetical protein [Clostridia bacterium]
MTLLFDGKNAFFAEREKSLGRPTVISVPTGYDLFCNGRRLIARHGKVTLPPAALHKGENRIALRSENRIIPAESLFYDGAAVMPVGLPADALLVQEHLALCELTRTVEALRERIAMLENAAKSRRLFT